jgi:hypothetical protein
MCGACLRLGPSSPVYFSACAALPGAAKGLAFARHGLVVLDPRLGHQLRDVVWDRLPQRLDHLFPAASAFHRGDGNTSDDLEANSRLWFAPATERRTAIRLIPA